MRRAISWLGFSLSLFALGCGGGGGGGNGVSGTVLTATGAPLPLARVMVVGEEPVETDLRGRFRSDAPDPYDLVVEDPSAGTLSVYMAVTNRKPIVVLSNQSGTASTTVTGTLTGGGGFPSGGALGHSFAFVSDDPEAEYAGSYGDVDDADGSYEAGALWPIKETTTGSLSVLQWDYSAAPPEEYTGFGKATGLSVASGVDLPNVTVALADVPEGSVSGAVVALPPGFEVSRHRLGVFTVREDGSLVFMNQFSSSATTSTSFDLTTPAGDEFWVRAGVSARDPITFRLGSVQAYSPPTAAGLTLTVPAPIDFTSPGTGATTFDLSESVAWTPFEHDGIYQVLLHGTGMGIAGDTVPFVILVTDDVTATFPDLTPLGISYGSGPRVLSLSATDVVATVDDSLTQRTLTNTVFTTHAPPGDSRNLEVTP